MPLSVVAIPSSRARASPSDVGSIPTSQVSSSHSLRSSLYIRSVPMLPEPMIAVFTFGISRPLHELDAHRAQPVVGGAHDVAPRDGLRLRQRPRHDDLAGLEG